MQTLTTAGVYTIEISENGNGVQTYALDLERFSPTPPDAVALVLQKNITAGIIAPTSTDMFTFNGATTGTYEIGVSLAANPSSDVCMSVFQPNGTASISGECTCYACFPDYPNSFIQDFTPPVNGTYLVQMFTNGYDATVNYSLEIECLLGTCPPQKPPCELTDSPSYDASTGVLTMDFTVATPAAATWAGWLVDKSKSQVIFSQALPVTTVPSQVTQTKGGVTASGEVGILSTITTPTQGITCSSFVTINTGT